MHRLAVIIVSYNVVSLLRDCLKSVAASSVASADWLAVEILVVDNASADGSAAVVASEFPHVRLFASATNLGFTGGNNLALRSLGFAAIDEASIQSAQPDDKVPPLPDFVLLLNPDTVVTGDALGQMTALLRDDSAVGAVGAQLRYGDGSFQHGAFRFPGLTQVALDLFPLAEISGIRRFVTRLMRSGLNGRYADELWQGAEPFPVDFVLGAALMVRSVAIQQIGLLDDDYFMYCEEMDWCLRLREAGWRVYALPTARITHMEGQSSRQVRWEAFERLWRSRFRFYQKHRVHYPYGFLFFLRLLIWIGLWMRAALVRRNFAQGKLSGQLLERELAAYTTIRRL